MYHIQKANAYKQKVHWHWKCYEHALYCTQQISVPELFYRLWVISLNIPFQLTRPKGFSDQELSVVCRCKLSHVHLLLFGHNITKRGTKLYWGREGFCLSENSYPFLCKQYFM